MTSPTRYWYSISICRLYLLVRRPGDPNEATWDAPAPATGRKLVRARAAATQEIVWETVITGRKVESRAVLQEAISGMEDRLGLGGEGADILKRCERTEIRLDSG